MSNDLRYSRQLSLDEIGPTGQKKLAKSRVAIIGCGGLGAIAAAYLAGAGVGYLRLIDGDQPELSNLHRQVFFQTDDKANKATTLAERLEDINTEILVDARPVHLHKDSIEKLLPPDAIDLVLECTDQAAIKHLVSDYCHINHLPLVYGAVHKTQGYLSLFANQAKDDCHLRDLFPAPDERLPTCAEVGVLNTAAGIIGLFQANEALKWILEKGHILRNQLLTYDCWQMQQQIIQLQKSYQGNVKDDYRSSNAGISHVADFKITANELNNWPTESYQLISLLNEIQEPILVNGAVRYRKEILQQGPNKKVFYCRRGRQSKAIAEQLRKTGIEAFYLA